MDAQTAILSTALKSSKSVLVLLHQHIPLPLAIWVNALVSLLKNDRKSVTVLVSHELSGWGQRLDAVYPADMVLTLEQLRQVLSIPFSGDRAGVTDVSYQMMDGRLEVTVIPTGGQLEIGQLRSEEHGHHYDLILGVGISPSHELVKKMQEYEPSVSGAVAHYVGTFASESVFYERLPFIKEHHVIPEMSCTELLSSLMDIRNSELTPQETELITLLAQQALRYAEGDVKGQAAAIERVKGLGNQLDSGRMSQVYMSDFAKQNRVLQQILASAEKYNESSVIVYSLSPDQTSNEQVSVSDTVATTFFLPRFIPNEKRIVCLSETQQRHHVYFEGDSDTAHKIAQRFGFALLDVVACGVVEGVSREKLIEDLRLLAGDQTMSPEMKESVIPTPKKIIAEPEVQVLQGNTPITQHEEWEEELDSGEVMDAAAQELSELTANSKPVEQVQETVPVSESLLPTPVPTQEIPVSSGVDFAAIAKKMRESIT